MDLNLQVTGKNQNSFLSVFYWSPVAPRNCTGCCGISKECGAIGVAGAQATDGKQAGWQMMANRLADAGEQAGKQESNRRQASRQAIAG